MGLKERSRVEQFERIRRDARDEGMSIRALAAKHKVHRRTVGPYPRILDTGCDYAAVGSVAVLPVS